MGRHYHTVRHLEVCLRELDDAPGLALSPAEVELALWFHDAIYRTHRNDNESRSAEWAARFLAEHGAAADVVSNVREFVMATAHAAVSLTGDAALVVDIDLSILGKPQAVYDEFERNVRREYWWVRKARFGKARCAILGSFLDRPVASIIGRASGSATKHPHEPISQEQFAPCRHRTYRMTTAQVILRKWTGRIRTAQQEEYVDYIVGTGLEDYAKTPGNLGFEMLLRDLGNGETEVSDAQLVGVDGFDSCVRRRQTGARALLPGRRQVPGAPSAARRAPPRRRERVARPATCDRRHCVRGRDPASASSSILISVARSYV